MGWADETRRMKVRTNADTPEQAKKARSLGAQGIGLCRTEHMFFDEKRIAAMREMILASDREARRKALDKLLPFQTGDFVELFRGDEGPAGQHPLARSAAARVPAAETQVRSRSLAQIMKVAPSEITRKVQELARVQPDARSSRRALGSHLSGDQRDAGARHPDGRVHRAEGRRERSAGDHDPARPSASASSTS